MMAEELQLSIEAMLYGATDAKLRDVSSMLKLQVAGETNMQLINDKGMSWRRSLQP